MRLHASGTLRRIYRSRWLPHRESARAVALLLAHSYLFEHRPDLRALGLEACYGSGAHRPARRKPLPKDKMLSEYGRAVKQPRMRVLDMLKKAQAAGVTDGSVQGSF